MPLEKITSFQNPKIKQLKKLRDKREREKTGLFVIDYARDLERALAYGYMIDYAFYCPAMAASTLPQHLLEETQLYEVTQELIENISYRENPSEIVAVLRQKPAYGIEQTNTLAAPHILTMVGLQKPGNIGALLRSADAAGIQAVFLVDTALDIYNPNIIRSSTGACFLPNLYTLTSQQALTFFRRGAYQVISATSNGSTSLFDVDFSHKIAVVLGTEDKGLSDFWLRECDLLVKIPMIGHMVDSLNVSVSGAVIMYEMLRQTLKNSY